MSRFIITAALALGAALVLPALVVSAQTPMRAATQLRDARGQVIGSATFTQQPGGVQVRVEVRGLDPGIRGIHIHAVGRCDSPDFMSAGGHFNPDNRQHGLRNPQGPHAGDLPNFQVGANRTGTLDVLATRVSVSQGANALLQPNGTALVIHAGPDDDMTDPAGNSGGRIACGVIQAAPATGPVAQLPRTGDIPLGWPVALLGGALFLAGVALRRHRRRSPPR